MREGQKGHGGEEREQGGEKGKGKGDECCPTVKGLSLFHACA